MEIVWMENVSVTDSIQEKFVKTKVASYTIIKKSSSLINKIN